MRKRIFLVLGLLTLSFVLLTLTTILPNVLADQTANTIFDGDEVKSVSWSNDSKILAFYEGSDIPLKELTTDYSQGKWWRYDVAANTLSAQIIWPINTELAVSQQTKLKIPKNTFSWLSPNNRYFIYVESQTENDTYHIVLRDQQLQHQYVLSAVAKPLFLGGSDSFQVFWSNDSTRLVIKTELDDAIAIDYFSFNLSDLASTKRTSISKLNISNFEYAINDVLALSGDGRLLLVRATKAESSEIALVLVDLSNIVSGKILEGSDYKTVIGAQFASSTIVRAITQSDFLQIDLAKNKAVVVSKLPKMAMGQKASFSPDGKQIAIISTASNKSSSRVFLLDGVSGVIMRNTPRRIATATPKFQTLVLTTECSPNPSEYHLWKVTNANPYDISFTWEILNSVPQKVGKITVPAAINNKPGEVTIKAKTTKQVDTIVIYVEGSQDQNLSSSSVECPTPTASK